jgi:hypothetical protein
VTGVTGAQPHHNVCLITRKYAPAWAHKPDTLLAFL